MDSNHDKSPHIQRMKPQKDMSLQAQIRNLKKQVSELQRDKQSSKLTVLRLTCQNQSLQDSLSKLNTISNDNHTESKEIETDIKALLQCKDVKSYVQESDLNKIFTEYYNLTQKIHELLNRTYSSAQSTRGHKRHKSMSNIHDISNNFPTLRRIDLDSLSLELLSKFEDFADRHNGTEVQMIKNAIRRKHKKWQDWNFSEVVDFLLTIRDKSGRFICESYKYQLNNAKQNLDRQLNTSSEGQFSSPILDDGSGLLRKLRITNNEDIKVIKQEINTLPNKKDVHVGDMIRKYLLFQKPSSSVTSPLSNVTNTYMIYSDRDQSATSSVSPTPTPHNFVMNTIASNDDSKFGYDEIDEYEGPLSLVSEGKQPTVEALNMNLRDLGEQEQRHRGPTSKVSVSTLNLRDNSMTNDTDCDHDETELSTSHSTSTTVCGENGDSVTMNITPTAASGTNSFGYSVSSENTQTHLYPPSINSSTVRDNDAILVSGQILLLPWQC